MKTNYIFKAFAALLTGCAIFAVSCDKQEQVAVSPVFPDLVEDNNVAPGSTLTLQFEVNMDWSLSISDENLRWFWIDDNTLPMDKVSGKVAQLGTSEKVSVKIGVSETEEFDTDRSCELTLTMGGESKVIAKYMRPAKSVTFALAVAEFKDGAFVLGDDGKYVYSESEVSDLSLVWSDIDADFRMPVRLTANRDWTLDAPQWLQFQEPENTAGVVEMVLTAASFEDVSGKAVFKVKGTDTVLKEVQVSAPGCAELNVFPAQLDENGELTYGEDGYVYVSEPVDAFTLVWPEQDFRMPVKVEAKCNWTLELPKWLTARYSDENIQDKAGVVAFTLLGNPLYYPLEETVGEMVFKFDGQTVKTVDVTIPGVKDKFSYGMDMNLTSWEFNAASELLTTLGYQKQAAGAWIFGTKDACVAAVEIKDGKRVADDPQWLKIEVAPYVDGAEVLQQRTVTVSPEVNDGVQRQAYVIFSDKAYKQEDYFNSDGTLKEQMKSGVVSLIQYGSDIDYVTMLSSEADMSSAGVTFADNPDPRLVKWFGETDYRYILTYSNQYARDKAFMSFAKPYASYKIFDGARADKTSDAGFWLKFSSTDGNVVDMYMDMPLPDSKTSGYIVFYDAEGAVLAIIECVFDPVVVVEEIVVEFTDMSSQYAGMTGASLVRLSEGDIYEHFCEGGVTVYQLTYKTEGMPLKIKIPANIFKHNVNPYKYRTFFKVNNTVYDEYFGPNDVLGEILLDDEGAVEIYMNRPDEYQQIGTLELPENVYLASVNFLDKAENIVFVLVCMLDLSE